MSERNSAGERFSLYPVFCEAARCGSISGAAKRLYVSQPAVSNAVAQLEASLGVKLFNRSSRGITLTEEGQVLYEHVCRSLEQLERGEDKLRAMNGLEGGVLRVGASDMTLKFFLLDYIERFKQNYPLVRITVTNAPTPRSLRSLREGIIDFAVVSGPLEPESGVACLRVRDVRDIAVATERYAALYPNGATPAELCRHPLIMLEEGTSTRSYLDSCMPGLKKPDIELATSDLILDFARRSFGIAYIVEDFARWDIESGALREIPLLPPLPLRSFYLVYRTDTPLSAAAERLVSMIRDSGQRGSN